MQSEGTVRVAVLFVDFDYGERRQSTEEVFNINVPAAERYLEAASYGKLNIEFEPLHEWLELSYNVGYWLIRAAIERADPVFDFSDIDSVLVITDPADWGVDLDTFIPETSSAGILADGSRIMHGVIRGSDVHDQGGSRPEWGGYVVARGIGHNLGLVDLDNPGETDFLSRDQYVGNFGLMGNVATTSGNGGSLGGFVSMYGTEMLAWHRWQLAWLDEDQVACVTSFPATVRLTPVAVVGGTKAVVVPLSPTRALVAESRRKLGHDANTIRSGVLVYTVDTTKPSGTGPIIVYGSSSSSKIPDSSALLKPGDTLIVEGYQVAVEERTSDGDLITISAPEGTAVAEATMTPACAADLIHVSVGSSSQCHAAEAVSRDAFSSTRARLSESRGDTTDLKIRVSPTAHSVVVSNVLTRLQNGLAFWSNELPADLQIVIVVSSVADREWLIEEARDHGHDMNSVPERMWKQLAEGGPGAFLGLYKTGVLYFIRSEPLEEVVWVSAPAHELTHHVQESLYGSAERRILPCWWEEGEAAYFGVALTPIPAAVEVDYEYFMSMRDSFIEAQTYRIDANGRSVSDWTEWLEANGPSEGICSSESDVYGPGLVATEYLLGQYGLARMTNMMSAFGPAVSWQSVMEQTYGITIPQLYEEISVHLRAVFGRPWPH